MDVRVNVAVGSAFTCATCGLPVNPTSVTHELWHHHDFFSFATYLHAEVPVLDCPCCGINAVQRPWTIGASQFRQIS